jgi:hypothetical protein
VLCRRCAKNSLNKFKTLTKLPPIFEADNTPFTESELAAFINEKGTLVITDLVLEQLRCQNPSFLKKLGFSLDDNEELVTFLRYHELLGNAILYFFREIHRQEPRAKTTLYAL